MPELKISLSVGEIVAGSYSILGMAGAGGMGVVYRAQDIKLERTVALKFLPDELNASGRDKERFLREARTASSLDHPNVGTIHGIEETPDGRAFIVMAFYEGKSLAQRIRAGPIASGEGVEIALQIAHGLAAAHAREIVHRDIKPSNIMLTPAGVVKIVDFGLAQVASSQTISETGITGTIAYMSPEQTLGRGVDRRSDIWALGLVLAEMLTGRNPIERETASATVVAILNEPPHALEGVPIELQQIVYRALSKDPARRYQNCTEVIADLEAVRSLKLTSAADRQTPGKQPLSPKHSRKTADIRKYIDNAARSSWPGAAPQKRDWRSWLIAPVAVLLTLAVLLSFPVLRNRLNGLFFPNKEKHVAVLPFDNIGNNPENAALVDGLMDSLSGKLSNLAVGKKSLWVVPPSEVRRLNVTDPSAALKKLGANLVVKGSVERDGQDVQLQLNLIDTKTMRQIGSADVEDAAGDLATLQNEAVARLAGLMDISVTADMLRNTGGHVDPAAYEDYLTALGHMQRYDKPGNLDLAVAALKKSIQTDPNFALGYAQIGEAYRLKYQVDKNSQWLTEAEANCRKAIEIDNRIPETYVTLGRIHDAAGKHDLALQEFQHALSLNDRDPSALAGLARAYENAGRIPDAEAAYRRAAAMRPNDWEGYDNLGMFLDRHGKYPDSIAQFKHALQLTPDNAQVLLNLGAAYIDSGDAKALPLAESALKKSIEINPSYGAYANLGDLLYLEHRYREAVEATQHALKLDSADYLVWDNLRLEFDWLHDASGAQRAVSSEKHLLLASLKLHPQDATADSLYADLSAKYGPRDQAIPHIETALALSPNDPDVLEATAAAYKSLGDRKMAVRYMNEAFAKGFPWQQALDDPEAQSLLNDPGIHPPKK